MSCLSAAAKWPAHRQVASRLATTTPPPLPCRAFSSNAPKEKKKVWQVGTAVAIAAASSVTLCKGEQLRHDKKFMLRAVHLSGLTLMLASKELQNDKHVVSEAIKNHSNALLHASSRLQDDKEIVMKAVQQNGNALKHASESLRGDKEVVLAAVKSSPDALKFALGALTRDKDCLIASGLWDENHEELKQQKPRKIAMSTRFAIKPDSKFQATVFTAMLKNHDYIRNGNFVVYSPNAFDKSTCDPTGNYTNYNWKCRGTRDTCQKEESLKTGPPKDKSCWRYSYRYHLQEAKESFGFMLQFIESEKSTGMYYQEHGKGQILEAEMAASVGTKVFVVHRPRNRQEDVQGFFDEDDLEVVIAKIQKWYQGGCKDMSPCRIHFLRTEFTPLYKWVKALWKQYR